MKHVPPKHKDQRTFSLSGPRGSSAGWQGGGAAVFRCLSLISVQYHRTVFRGDQRCEATEILYNNQTLVSALIIYVINI